MPAKSRPDKSPWYLNGLLKTMLLLLLVAAFLGALVWAGRWGLDQLRDSPRFVVAFTEIDCEPPVGMKKQDFLDEVRFISRLPERLNVLDNELPQNLRDGFGKHPWVEKVDDVEIKPTKQIVVKLTHRTPVLAVKVDGAVRAVDGHGILLYSNAPTLGLPVFDGVAKPPQGMAGTPWGDPNIEAAARKLQK